MNAPFEITAVRTFCPSDRKIADFVTWLSTSRRETWLSYLVVLGLNEHLAKYIPISPFIRGIHLDSWVDQAIRRYSPRLDADERRQFLFEMQKYIRRDKFIQKEFEYREPSEFCF